MKLLESIPCKKGITLNSQLVDLLSILDENIPKEEQDKKIEEYISNLRDLENRYKEAVNSGKKYEFSVNTVIDNAKGISEDDKKKLKEIYLGHLSDLSVCDKSKMMKVLEENGLNPEFHSLIASQAMFYEAKEGIYTLTPEKVRKLYDHMFKDGNKYDRVTFDNVGKYSGYVAFDGETYTPENLDKMVEFCERHGMKSKINTLMFYADFPDVLEASLAKRVDKGEISEEDKKQILKKSLIDYAVDIGRRYGDRIDAVDIFNELIYDYEMREEKIGSDGNDVFEEDENFHLRENGWQKYLSLEDLCEMALAARKEMPNATFTYNDMNWVNPEKRKEIIKIVKQIKEIEARYRLEGKLAEGEKGLIDNIGVEAHLSTDVDLDEIENTFRDIETEIGLSVEVTEFDVARDGDNPLSEKEVLRQGKVFQRFMEIAKAHPKMDFFTIWSQSDDLSFMNLKNPEKAFKKVYASVLNDDFEEKDFEVREFVPQNFNFHTHTKLCGHADGEVEEYIQKAIEGGITSLGFSDHTPNLIRKSTPGHEMSMEEFETKYIPALKAVREKYGDQIDIKFGLESEYFGEELENIDLDNLPEDLKPYSGLVKLLKDSRETTESELDYLILGQHGVLARNEEGNLIMPPKRAVKNSPSYPMDYALTVVEAIKSGKFAYIAHPDIFLEARDEVPENLKGEYNKNAMKAAEMICEVAKQYDIPLEVNLGSIGAIKAGVEGKHKLSDGSYPYPVPSFWEMAAKKGCKVLIGTDAHEPSALVDKKIERIAVDLLDGLGLEYLESFEPKGIGKEGSLPVLFGSQSVGKAFVSRDVSGKDEAKNVVANEQKEVVNAKDGNTTQTHNDD